MAESKALALLNKMWFAEGNIPTGESINPFPCAAGVRFVCKLLSRWKVHWSHSIALNAWACLPLRQGLLHNQFLDSCTLIPKHTASYQVLSLAWICSSPLSLPLPEYISLRDGNKLRLSESMNISVCTTPRTRLSCCLQPSLVNMGCSTQIKWWFSFM